MKQNKSLYLLLAGLIFLFFACEKDQPNSVPYDAYTWAALDDQGGTWKPVLTTLDESIITAPLATNDPAYIAEVAEVKSRVDGITDAEKEKADYWSNNPILRWNEIAREFAAKYNLAPAPNPDGTYPVPSAATPDVYPLFPFSHPPYTCRMFSYLSVAQYDAMIGTWKLKYKYNRPALSKTLTSKAYLDDQSLPSYPSDGAAITQAAVTVLSAMYPLEKEIINAKAAEHYDLLLATGLNTKSDIEAGKKVGLFYAQKSMARAGGDGMKNAQTSKAIADSIKNVAFQKYGWSFQNMELPERKIGLVARFGKLKTWSLTDVSTLRPPLPPAPGSPDYKIAEQELLDIAKNRTAEQRRIAIYWADGTNTYTPPGHWNRIACDEIVSSKYNPLRSARTLAYMNMAVMDAGVATWDTKYHYHYPRPNQIIPGYKTLLGTPNFPGYVSGHSAFSAAAASVLSYIFPSSKSAFDAYAKEASNSRIYGGIHFRFDCESGLTLGKQVGEEVLKIAAKDGAQ